jgi:hypothetical protein
MTQEEKPKIRAILIGANNYIASENLKYAVQDASSVKDSLGKLYENIDMILLTDEREPRYQPIRTNILSNIKLISENVKDNENILFYFAGHGEDIDGEPVVLPSDYRDEVGMDAAIKIEDIKTSFVNTRAKFKLLIFDSCHSGAAKGRAESGRMSNSMYKAFNEIPEGFAVISACGLDQVSYEDETLHHGVFTHFLLEGIEGKADANNDKLVTINELYDYLVSNVKEWVFQKFNASQIPNIRCNFGGAYVLSRLPHDSPRTEDTMGTEFFTGINLWQNTYEMQWLKFESEGIDSDIESALEKSVEQILLVLRKEYGIKGLQDKGNTIEFQDGRILRISDSDEKIT